LDENPKTGGFMEKVIEVRNEANPSFMYVEKLADLVTSVVEINGKIRLKEIYPGNRILRPGHYNPHK
jgi:hypothetical protein